MVNVCVCLCAHPQAAHVGPSSCDLCPYLPQTVAVPASLSLQDPLAHHPHPRAILSSWGRAWGPQGLRRPCVRSSCLAARPRSHPPVTVAWTPPTWPLPPRPAPSPPVIASDNHPGPHTDTFPPNLTHPALPNSVLLCPKASSVLRIWAH